MKPLLSILCITYNQEKFVTQTLDSFLMQKTSFPFEILIHDDASTDGTQEILRRYEKNHPGLFKVTYEKDNQYSQGNLKFIEDLYKQCEGKYIAICEGDDYWTDPGKLQLQVDFLERDPDYAICFHPTRVFYEDGQSKESIWPSLNKKSQLTPEELIRENFIPTHSVVYRRQKYGALPTNVMPFDLYMHLYHARFGKIGLVDKVMSVYRRHEAGIWSSSYRDTDKLWQAYGLAHVALFVEVLSLYQDNPSVKEAAYNSLAAILSTLMDLDNRYESNLLQQALNQYPDALGAFMSSTHKEKELSHDKDLHIEELNKEIVNLREQLFTLKGQLYQIRRTPVIGDLIRLKAILGRTRRKVRLLRGRSQHYYHLAAGLIPAGTRRTLKGILRYNLRSRLASVRVIAARAWPTDRPLVSVVIPYYNRADTIDDTLNSLATQSFTNFEIIIVDDGSEDAASLQKLSDLEAGNPKLQIIHQHNQGVAAARNTGVKNAKGKYIICLDSDDLLDATYIEKCTVMLETNPDIALVSTYQDMFGVTNELFKKSPYDPVTLFNTDNMVITAAEFRRDAWRVSGGYKSGIGYEDWEFWISLAENGFWGKVLPEALFKYRTSMQSRYVDDKGEMHWKNMQTIRELHPKYKVRLKKLMAKRQYSKQVADPRSAFVNLARAEDYAGSGTAKPKILITVPWLTFGGAETLIYNFCREIKEQYDISFVTGLKSEHEWEYKFREISGQIYHLASMFDDERLYLEFISNYIKTRHIDILHIIHNGFTFGMLQELKDRFPQLKVAITLFNDRVNYFEQSVQAQSHIDAFSTDNTAVAKHFRAELPEGKPVTVIPNGINCFEEFNPNMFDRQDERKALGLSKNDLGVVFVGRISEEKNPDVFVRAARTVIAEHKNIKFIMIGSGPLTRKINKMIKETDSNQLVSIGYQAEPARFLAAADIFVLPSSIEGFPLSLLEAMAMADAVVASRVGAIPDVIQDGQTGFVVSPGSASEITNVIKRLAGDPSLLGKIKAAARKKVETEYSTVSLGQRYSGFYRELSK